MEILESTMPGLKLADTDYEVLPLIENRWSPRVFFDQKVEKEDLRKLFEAARWAPSSNNAQPWHFLYAYKGEVGYPDMFSCLTEFNQSWVGNASVLVFTVIKEKFDDGKANYHALHDLGLAVGIMCMQAESMGIAIHQMAGVKWEEAQKVFEIPEGYHVATAIAIGYYGGDVDKLPDDLKKKEQAKRNRKPQSEFVFEGKWGPLH